MCDHMFERFLFLLYAVWKKEKIPREDFLSFPLDERRRMWSFLKETFDHIHLSSFFYLKDKERLSFLWWNEREKTRSYASSGSDRVLFHFIHLEMKEDSVGPSIMKEREKRMCAHARLILFSFSLFHKGPPTILFLNNFSHIHQIIIK